MEKPWAFAASSAPLTISAMKGSSMVVATTPMVFVRPVARLRPIALTRKSDSFAILRMRSAVSRFTSGLFRSARERNGTRPPSSSILD